MNATILYLVVMTCVGQGGPATRAGSREAYSAIAQWRVTSETDAQERTQFENDLAIGRRAIEAEIQAVLKDDPQGEKNPTLRKILAESKTQSKQTAERLDRELRKLKTELDEIKRGKISQNDIYSMAPVLGKKPIAGQGSRSSCPELGMSFSSDPNTRIRRYFLFRTAKDKKNAIAEQQRKIAATKDELERLQADDVIRLPRLPVDALAIGKIGQLFFSDSIILQAGAGKGFRVLQVIDKHNMLVTIYGKPVWVTGVSTVGIVDDSQTPLVDLFEVSDTKQYTNGLGQSNTVFVLKAVRFAKDPTH